MRPRCMLIGWLALVGCYHPAPPAGAPCDDRSPCPGGQQCVDGTCGGGSTDAPISAPDATLDSPVVVVDACSAPVACVNDQVVGCGAPVDCPWGCLTSGTSDQAHCGRITPSNVSWSLLPANPATVTIPFGALWTLDTDDGTITSDNDTIVLGAGVTSVLQNGARVLALGSFVLDANTTLRVVGTHPLIVLAADSVTLGVSSLIDLDGGCRSTVLDPTCAGAGGGHGAIAMTAATGCGPGGDGNENVFSIGEAGGGGGGMGTDGGNGGAVLAGFGAPGATCAQPGLYGGSGGGVGGVTAAMTASGGRGGGGGGAIQFTAANVVTASGTISAAGAGGETGHPVDLSGGGGGGGGGAGGGILLEAGRVDLLGVAAANGGGGGGNAVGTGNGATGSRTTTCANGGGAGPYAAGGNGGCRDLAATSQPGTGTVDRGGGGGGAAGRITVRRRDGATTGVVSPAPSVTPATFE